jgi:hypothetical protein
MGLRDETLHLGTALQSLPIVGPLHRSIRAASLPAAPVWGLLLILVVARSGAPSDETRITSRATVRLRSGPSTTASIEAELTLGTELVVLARTNESELWFHVRTDDGRDGWILGTLSTPFDREHPEQVIESIVVGGLSRDSQIRSTSFATHVQLVNLIDRAAATLTERQAQARFALYRLRAMRDAFTSIPFGRGDSDPYRGWIREHQGAARYNEPAGQWMVDPRYVLRVHEQNRDSAVADEIAWLFVRNGWYGECEGDVPCYVAMQNELNGEYLRLHPRGRHTDEANADIALALNDAMDNLRRFPDVLGEFDPGTRCGELSTATDSLVAAITASSSRRQAVALAALDRFAQLCR